MLERGGWAPGWLELRSREAALDLGDGGSKRGARFLSFPIPVSPSGLSTRSHDPFGREWCFVLFCFGLVFLLFFLLLSYRRPSTTTRPMIQKIFRGLHLLAVAGDRFE